MASPLLRILQVFVELDATSSQVRWNEGLPIRSSVLCTIQSIKEQGQWDRQEFAAKAGGSQQCTWRRTVHDEIGSFIRYR